MSAYNYYPWNSGFNPYGQPMMQQPTNYLSNSLQSGPQYMIQVDGEIGAKAWQPQTSLAPNTVIPLWDFDGQHVYFKSTDAYGRMNPIRKGRVVFEDEPKNLPQGQSGIVSNEEQIEQPKYITKDDLEDLKEEIQSMLNKQIQQSFQNQNGSHSSGNNNNRGGNRT